MTRHPLVKVDAAEPIPPPDPSVRQAPLANEVIEHGDGMDPEVPLGVLWADPAVPLNLHRETVEWAGAIRAVRRAVRRLARARKRLQNLLEKREEA